MRIEFDSVFEWQNQLPRRPLKAREAMMTVKIFCGLVFGVNDQCKNTDAGVGSAQRGIP